MGDREQIPAPDQRGEAGDVVAALRDLRADVKRLADDLARLAQERRSAAEVGVAAAVEDAKGRVSRAADGIEGFASELEADVRARIRTAPLTSVIAAALIGYGLRVLRGSRRRRCA